MLAVACADDTTPSASESTTTSTTTTTTTTLATTTTSTTTSTTTTTLAPTTTVDPATAGSCDAAPAEMRTLVDPTRVTPPTNDTDELPSRTIDVWIDRPTADGPWPLIVFSHGLTGHPRSHVTHRQTLAEQCFVVVAPAFPLTNNDVPDGFRNAGDIEGQVGDVSFVIDQALADPTLGAAIDDTRIGAIGHSLGGLTTAGAALSSDGDPRITAAVVMSAGFGEVRDDVAVMVLHGDADALVPVASSISSYGLVTGRGLFATLVGGDHIEGIIDGPSPLGPVVRTLTGAFFAYEFGNGDATVAAVSDLPPDLVTVEARSAAGPLDDWLDYFSA